jgi:AraC-like DNA-binding protein/quercetin dioxygenase-like cupin family protein
VSATPREHAVSGASAGQLSELRALIARHAARGERTEITGVLVSATPAPTRPMASHTGTVMALIAQGAKRLAIGDRTYEYRAGQYLVASVDLPITGHFSEASPAEPALGFGLVIRPAVVATMLLDAPARSPSAATGRVRGPGPPPALGVAVASPELVDAVIRMLRLLDRPDDRQVLAPMIEREILWRLVTGPLGESVRQTSVADSSLTHVSRAVRWITDNYSQPFRVEQLARMCGMSTSAFHRTFAAVTGLSPIQFQKQIRLQRSRLLLIAGSGDVASTGYRVGYGSASQFSRDYRRQFGLPPGQDAERLRASTAFWT